MSLQTSRVVVAFTHFASKRPARIAGVFCAAALSLMAWQDSPPSLVARPTALPDRISIRVTDEPRFSKTQPADADDRISILDCVRLPGQYSITIPIMLFEALAQAGWVTPDAAPEGLLTTHDSPPPRRINLADARKEMAVRSPARVLKGTAGAGGLTQNHATTAWIYRRDVGHHTREITK
jgi:hypothetical protein